MMRLICLVCPGSKLIESSLKSPERLPRLPVVVKVPAASMSAVRLVFMFEVTFIFISSFSPLCKVILLGKTETDIGSNSLRQHPTDFIFRPF